MGCRRDRRYRRSNETQYDENTSHEQADTCLQSAVESGVNSDTDHTEFYVNPIRNDADQEYLGLQRIARSDGVLYNAQAGVGLRSSAPTLQNSQTKMLSLRVGSGEDTSFQNNGGSISSVIRVFYSLISKQNEAQNARNHPA